MERFEGSLEGHGGSELFYQSWRPESTDEVVAALGLVHGFGEHSGRYGNVVDWFVPKGYAVHAFDLWGNGRSPGPRGHVDSFDDFLEDVRAFLARVQQEEPGSPLFLLGHSQGGLIALDYALRDPSGLAGIVVSGPLLCTLPVSPALLVLAKALSRVWPGLTLESGIDVTAISRDPDVVEAYVSDPLVHGKGTPRLATELISAIDWTCAHASELALPCLIVHGSADRLAAPENTRSFFECVEFPDKERKEYAGYYHEVFNDLGKDKVLEDVEDWLQRYLP